MICFKNIKYALYVHLCHNVKNMYVWEDVHVHVIFFIDFKNIISYMLAIVPKCQRNTRRKTTEEKIFLPGRMYNL